MNQQNLHEFSVSELSNVLKRTVEENFSYVRVRGEISGFLRAGSGHLYFKLKDENAVLDSVCWKGVAANFSFQPEDGLEVVCEGKLSTYPARSSYQLVVAKMEPAGEGALMALLDERKRRLAAEGLFAPERKKKLPYIPSVIGVVTSPTGAVIRDILHRLQDRFPRHVILWPVQVQGEQAAPQIVRAIEGFNALPEGGPVPRPDLLIVARGGGSLEDLWAFNEEAVVRAAAASGIPLISAVGHETDTTLIDYASDVRAPTPTAAAEIAVPVQADLQYKTTELGQRLGKSRRRYFEALKEKLSGLARGIPMPRDILGLASQRLDDLGGRLPRSLFSHLQGETIRLNRVSSGLSAGAIRQTFNVKQASYLGLARLLESMSYRSVLQRGFAVVRDKGGKAVVEAKGVSGGKALDIEFRDGHVPVVAEDGGKPVKNEGLRHKKNTTSKKDQGSLF